MAQAIQYTGDNAAEVRELLKHLEVDELDDGYTLWTVIGHIYKEDWVVIDDNGKYAIYKPEEYASFKAAGLLKDEDDQDENCYECGGEEGRHYADCPKTNTPCDTMTAESSGSGT